ncbi:Hydroxyethylthiazole kinase [Streptococcus pneumoniae]|nr:Hydroxyethylthiazole kinase [Streptococcus pneumoniae]
MQEFTIPFL